MRDILVKVLLVVSLIMLGMTVFNHQRLEKKDAQITALTQSQDAAKAEIDRLKGQVGTVNDRLAAADAAQKRLQKSIDSLDKVKNLYPKRVKEIKDANVETKNLLDTVLPAGFRSLLNESAGGDKN